MRALAIPACATRTEAEGREACARMQRFGERVAAQGKLRAVESLAPCHDDSRA